MKGGVKYQSIKSIIWQSDKEFAQLLSYLAYCQDQFAEFCDIFCVRVLFNFSEKQLDFFHFLNVLLAWVVDVQFFQPFHFVHFDYCEKHAKCFRKQQLLNFLNLRVLLFVF
jgi:hypothetical protein